MHACLMALPDLDALIAEVDRTCDGAASPDGDVQPDWIALLRTAAGLSGRLQALGDDLVADYVEHCRMHGRSWNEIGAALGVTRQAAQQRYLAPHRRYAPEELSDELRAAMAAMKDVAVRHRNNYIGTEHVLWGLLAGPNSASRMLGGDHVDDLRERLGARLTMGASQAAERIAWTPYARKAIAIAEELADGRPIGCDDLLVGLVRVGRGVAATVLAESDVHLPSADG